MFVLRAFEDDERRRRHRPARRPPDARVRAERSPTSRARRASSSGDARRPSSTSSLAGEVALLEAAVRRLRGRRTALPVRRSPTERADGAAAVLPPHQQAACWRWSTSARTRWPSADAVVEAGRGRARRRGRGARRVACSSRRRRPSSPADERAELLEGLGLGEGALPRVVRAAYHLLGLRTFLTTGDKESRAWTFRAGAKAPECAGRHPLRPAARVHPGRGDPLGRAARASGRGTRPRSSASSGSRARTTRSPDGDVLEIRFNV